MRYPGFKKIWLLPLVLLLNGCSSGAKVVQGADSYSGMGPNEVYIVSHGWHTGFVIPAQKMYDAIPALKLRFAGASNLELGWGDQGFYQARKITAGLAVKAILWPTESVMHVVSVPDNVATHFPGALREKLCLSDLQLASLVQFIASSFERSGQGELFSLGQGIYGDSEFYRGVGDYYGLNTCNKWTAKGLKSAGMDIKPAFKLTASSVMNYLEAARTGLTGSPAGERAGESAGEITGEAAGEITGESAGVITGESADKHSFACPLR